MLAANQALMTVYATKVALEERWQPSGWQWLNAWKNWMKVVADSRIDPLRKFAARLKPYWRGIAARLRWPVHTGQLECINNRIKLMKRMAYGYRDSAFFRKIKAASSGIREESINSLRKR